MLFKATRIYADNPKIPIIKAVRAIDTINKTIVPSMLEPK